ncbi:Cax4 [Kluyveromyces lactis]|nr:Cax4 [Kluyveromyces lactis]
MSNLTAIHSKIPFDDTYILYDPNDLFSFICCYLSLLPVGILVFYFSWFIITREIEAVILAGGHVVNDIANNIIKNIIKETRPIDFGSFQKDSVRSGYGMPSAHSQFMGFFTMYIGLRIWCQWGGLNKSHKILASFGLLLASSGVVVSRVYLGYHSVKQVLVGVSIGALLGTCHFLASTIVRYIGLVDWFLSWRIVQLFLIKDSCFQAPFSLKDEYNAYLQRRQLSIKKKSD